MAALVSLDRWAGPILRLSVSHALALSVTARHCDSTRKVDGFRIGTRETVYPTPRRDVRSWEPAIARRGGAGQPRGKLSGTQCDLKRGVAAAGKMSLAWRDNATPVVPFLTRASARGADHGPPAGQTHPATRCGLMTGEQPGSDPGCSTGCREQPPRPRHAKAHGEGAKRTHGMVR